EQLVRWPDLTLGTEIEQCLVRRKDDEERERDDGEQEETADEVAQLAGERPRRHARQSAQHGERCLHGGGTLVARRPLAQSELHTTAHPRRMLDEIDVERGACEQAATGYCQQTRHVAHATLATWVASRSRFCSLASTANLATR